MKISNIFGKAMMVMAVAIFAFGVNAVEAKKAKKIGIQLYSVMSAMNKDPKGSIDKLADMGYNVFELVQWGGNPKVFGLDAEEFKAYCDTKGINVLSTHSSLQEDPAKEAEVMENWRKLFAVQKAVGGKYFVIPSYRVNYTEAEVKKMADYFNRVGKIAKEEFGLMLGYHNHSQEYKNLEGTNKVMWEYLVENTNPEYVFFEMDVYWVTMGDKDPVAYLQKYPERIKMLHIKDDFVIGESGKINFEGIFKQFYKNGYKDFVVEIETPRDLRNKTNADGSKYTQDQIAAEMFEAAKKSAAYLQNAKFVK